MGKEYELILLKICFGNIKILFYVTEYIFHIRSKFMNKITKIKNYELYSFYINYNSYIILIIMIYTYFEYFYC